jgi:hypothetical protein
MTPASKMSRQWTRSRASDRSTTYPYISRERMSYDLEYLRVQVVGNAASKTVLSSPMLTRGGTTSTHQLYCRMDSVGLECICSPPRHNVCSPSASTSTSQSSLPLLRLAHLTSRRYKIIHNGLRQVRQAHAPFQPRSRYMLVGRDKGSSRNGITFRRCGREDRRNADQNEM